MSGLSDKPVLMAFASQAQKRSFLPKHDIIHAGDAPATLFLLLEGSVTVAVEDDHGREIVLAYLNPGEFFGEMGLFQDHQARSAKVTTRTHILVAELSYEAFQRFAQQHPEVWPEVAGQLAERLRATTKRLVDLAFLDVQGRVAREILNLCHSPEAQSHPRGAIVRISRQELARIVGCSREMAGRVLKKLQEDGMVSVSGRSVLVLGVSPPAGAVKSNPKYERRRA